MSRFVQTNVIASTYNSKQEVQQFPNRSTVRSAFRIGHLCSFNKNFYTIVLEPHASAKDSCAQTAPDLHILSSG